jgi:DNA-binding transcriptional MerR regulator
MGDGGPLLAIGELARRAGVPVRTIRFWSDSGVLPPAARTASGRRLYDVACVARLDLVSTLRELGLGLDDVRRVLAGRVSIAEVAALHLNALDAQIRALRLHRAVLMVVVKRAAGNEEMTMMSKLAQMSAAERRRMIDDFTDEVFAGLKPSPASLAWAAAPNLPGELRGGTEEILAGAAAAGASLEDLAAIIARAGPVAMRAPRRRRRRRVPRTAPADRDHLRRRRGDPRRPDPRVRRRGDRRPGGPRQTGPEDDPTAAQRFHDALQESCTPQPRVGLRARQLALKRAVPGPRTGHDYDRSV